MRRTSQEKVPLQPQLPDSMRSSFLVFTGPTRSAAPELLSEGVGFRKLVCLVGIPAPLRRLGGVTNFPKYADKLSDPL
jgi:hypothetical protein